MTSSHNTAMVVVEAPGRRAWTIIRRLLRRPSVPLAGAFILLVLVAATVPQLLTSANPLAVDPSNINVPPGQSGYLLGSDALGRDLYTRIVYGAGPSVLGALIAVVLSFLGGAILGLLAGYLGGWIDIVISRLIDVSLAFPTLLFASAIVTVLGFGSTNVAIAVGIVGIAVMARVMRAEVLRVRAQTYIEAAGISGARWYTTIRRHVLPNAIGPLVVLATIEFGLAILTIASLSFLGFGAPPPSPEWGQLASEGRNYLNSAWWLSIFPGLVIALLVLSTNRIARAFDREVKR